MTTKKPTPEAAESGLSFCPGAIKSPPPPTARQLTMCTLALNVTETILEDVEQEKVTAPVRKKVSRILELIGKCRATLPEKEASAGAKRELRASRARSERYLDSLPAEPDIFLGWSMWVWAASGLLADCLCVCPDFFRGNNWRWLEYHVETLALALAHEDERVEEMGTALYEACAL